jgi:hypothetical protein
VLLGFSLFLVVISGARQHHAWSYIRTAVEADQGKACPAAL